MQVFEEHAHPAVDENPNSALFDLKIVELCHTEALLLGHVVDDVHPNLRLGLPGSFFRSQSRKPGFSYRSTGMSNTGIPNRDFFSKAPAIGRHFFAF